MSQGTIAAVDQGALPATASVVVIGAGQAGLQCAASLREAGFQGRLALLDDEGCLPYRRPPLSKEFLLGQAAEAQLHFRSQEALAALSLDFVPGRAAHAIDRERRQVACSDGTRLDYDHLVIATGARARQLQVPGAGLEGVCGLRTLDDARRLQQRLRPGLRAVVVGGGFIGLEFAAVAAALGCSVTVVESADRVLARAVSHPVSDYLQQRHREAGVDILTGRGVALLRADGAGTKVAGVELDDGRELPADLVLVGIGAQPNVEIASAAGLPGSQGIEVDARLLTADPWISAIGDVAAFALPRLQVSGRIESVQNAADQARYVAGRLMGKAAGDYTALPWFWSNQGQERLQIAGLRPAPCREVVRGDPASGGFSVFLYSSCGSLHAVESINQPRVYMLARRLLGEGGDLPEDLAGDPDRDLHEWFASRAARKAAGQPALTE